MKRRIGITGGSFDPIHDGHVAVMEEAKALAGLDEVWMWISHNPFKDQSAYAPLASRKVMCEERTQTRPWLKATDMEANFHDTKTASSLSTLKEMYPETEFIWIFGDDNFENFHKWDDVRFEVDGQRVPDWQYILQSFSVAVMHRPGYREAAIASEAAKYGAALKLDNPMDLSQKRTGWTFVANDTMPNSSTEIRKALRDGKKDIEGLSAFAEKTIRTNELYGLGSNFNKVAALPLPHMVNNTVNLEAFLTLANTANLVKTLVKKHMPKTSLDTFKTHFESCYQEAERSRFSKDFDAVPFHLEAGFIINDRLEDALAVKSKTEIKEALNTVLRNLSRLCIAEGLEMHRAVNIMRLVFEAQDLAPPKLALQSNTARIHHYKVVWSAERDLAKPSADIIQFPPSPPENG